MFHGHIPSTSWYQYQSISKFKKLFTTEHTKSEPSKEFLIETKELFPKYDMMKTNKTSWSTCT